MDRANPAGVEGPDDIGMRQPRHGLDFPVKALDRHRIGHARGGDDLDGDNAVQLLVPRLVNLAHAAFPKAIQDHVRAHHEPVPLAG